MNKSAQANIVLSSFGYSDLDYVKELFSVLNTSGTLCLKSFVSQIYCHRFIVTDLL